MRLLVQTDTFSPVFQPFVWLQSFALGYSLQGLEGGCTVTGLFRTYELSIYLLTAIVRIQLSVGLLSMVRRTFSG